MKSLKSLVDLNIEDCELNNIEALRNLPNLTKLILTRNNITDISPLKNLNKLNFLYLKDNPIKDFSPVKDYYIYLSNKDFTLGNEYYNETVTFKDSNLEKCIRNALGKDKENILLKDLLYLTELNLQNKNISDISGIEKASNLIKLNLNNNKIKDFTPIASLNKLKKLYISNNETSDYNVLKSIYINLIDKDFNLNLMIDSKYKVNNFEQLCSVFELAALVPDRTLEIEITNPSLANETSINNATSYLFDKYDSLRNNVSYISKNEIYYNEKGFFYSGKNGEQDFKNLTVGAYSEGQSYIINTSKIENLRPTKDDTATDIVIQSSDKKIVNIAKEITKGKKSDYEKLLAIHDYVANNIEYDVYSYRNSGLRAPQDAISVLENKKAVCEGYANLTAALCRAVNIPCQVLPGYVPTHTTWDVVFEVLPHASSFLHAWNRAYVDNRWVLLDTTWDAGYVSSEDVFVKNVRHAYFDPDPIVFASNHTIYYPNPDCSTLKEFYFQVKPEDASLLPSLAFEETAKKFDDSYGGYIKKTPIGYKKDNCIKAYILVHLNQLKDNEDILVTFEKTSDNQWNVLSVEKVTDYLLPTGSYIFENY